MSTAIVVLNTGERVISNLQEVREENKEDGRPICLLMIRPYTLNVEKTEGGPENQEVQVRFSKWLPYSSDIQFKIPFNSVMAVGAADTGLEEAYLQTVAQAIQLEERATKTTVTEGPAAETTVVSVDDQDSEV